MAYRLKIGRPTGAEVIRVLEKQLRTAARALHRGRRGAIHARIHLARRRVKKALAAIHLVRPSLATSARDTARRLKQVKRALGDIADGEAVIQTVGRVAKRDPFLDREVGAVLKKLQRAELRLERSIATRQAMAEAAQALNQAADDVHGWQVDRTGFGSIARGLRRIYRRARRSMRFAQSHPSAESYHEWRKRSKEFWLALRLLEARCHGEMTVDQRRAEVLDEALGEHHNTVLLMDLFLTQKSARPDVRLRWLRALRAYRHELRAKTKDLGAQVYADRPSHLMHRVRLAWKARRPVPAGRRRWPRAA